MTPRARRDKTPIARRVAIGASALSLIGVAAWYFFAPSQAELEQQALKALFRGDLVAARTALLRMSPRDEHVLQLLADVASHRGEKDEHVQWLERLADASPNPAQRLVAAGARAFEYARPMVAERLYRRAIKAAPESLAGYSGLARLYLAWHRGDDLRRVIADADAAKVALIDDPVLLWLWVTVDRVDWQEDDAKKWLQSVAQTDPLEPYTAAARLRGFVESGASISAESDLWKKPANAWPLAPAQAAAYLDETRAAPDRLNRAVSILEEVSGDALVHAEVWYQRGRVARAVGDFETALNSFRYATELDPLFVAPRYQRGHLLAGEERHREAKVELDRAVQFDEFVQRSLRLLQSTDPSVDDLLSAAKSAIEVGQERWAQLVCGLIERKSRSVEWPRELAAVRTKTIAPLSVPHPAAAPPKFVVRKTAPPEHTLSTATAVNSSPSAPVIQFVDTTESLGVNFRYEYGHSTERWLMETLGGGVAVLDYDRDGWPDLYFAQGGVLQATGSIKTGGGALFRNIHGQLMETVTEPAQATIHGYSHGCAVGDINQDGFSDLLVCHYRGLTLLMNGGDGTWRDATATAIPVEGSGDAAQDALSSHWLTSAAFSDVDGDGDLDLYLAAYCHAPLSRDLKTCRDGNQFAPCRPGSYPQEPDTLLINSGFGGFVDRSQEAGIAAESGYGLGVIVADFDQDGAPEIFVGNDTTPNFLWHRSAKRGADPSRSNGDATFSETGLIAGVALDGSGRAEACMGIACGDVNGDGRLDLFVTNFFDETCTFYENLGGLQFDDRTLPVGLTNAGRRLMGWGCQFFDADNDGWLDLAILNGHLHDTAQRPQLYRNQQGRFQELTSSSGDYFQEPRLGRSIATWDYNRDGRIDLVASHQSEPASVLRNDSEASRSVVLTLVGTQSARDGTGAIVRARIGEQRLVRLFSSQGGYLSACQPEVVLGLGLARQIDQLEIEWPSGVLQHFEQIAGSQHFLIREGRDELVSLNVDVDRPSNIQPVPK